MLDHISLAVADIARSRAFYDRVLATLGSRRVMDVDDAPDFVASGYGGTGPEPAFWIGDPKPVTGIAPPVPLASPRPSPRASTSPSPPRTARPSAGFTKPLLPRAGATTASRDSGRKAHLGRA